MSWKAHLQSGLMLFGLVALLALLGLSGLRFYRAYQSDLGIEETGVVTVVSVIGGHSGKWGGWFDHRVRFESGSEGIMMFREMFPRGTRVWVSYRRFPHDERFEVKLYTKPKDP